MNYGFVARLPEGNYVFPETRPVNLGDLGGLEVYDPNTTLEMIKTSCEQCAGFVKGLQPGWVLYLGGDPRRSVSIFKLEEV
ncbi:hypothetical protein A3K63_02730 [Candidatus Micrarchaeota archaeon RBG_16_49_10]|nr:MAG: hypothetical protein A3K63_02730 [Candidatus Micrarchaeota archaeon RBG_16_49_10]